MITADRILLGDAESIILPAGDRAGLVERGTIEAYLVSPDRRRLVLVVEPGGYIFPLPTGSPMELLLLAPEGAVISAVVDDSAMAAGATRWIEAVSRTTGAAPPDISGPAASIEAVQRALLELYAHHESADARRDTLDIARLATRDGNAAIGEVPGRGLAAALASIAASFGLPPPRPGAGGVAGDFAATPQLARAMGFRARRVTLPQGWWRTNLGSLLIRAGERGAVTALLWHGGGYRGPDGPIDADAAQQLDGWGYIAHAALPLRVTGLVSLGREILRGTRDELLWIVFAGLAVAIVGLAVPVATGWLFQDIVPAGEGGLLVAVGLAFVAAAIVQAVLGAARGLAQARVEGPSSLRLAAGLTDRLLKLPTRFFKTLSAGDLNQRIQAVETMRALIVGTVLSSGVTALFSVVYLGLLFAYDVRLALIALAVAIIYAGVLFATRLGQVGSLREAAELDGRISGVIYETLDGIAKLRTAAAEPRALSRWRLLYEREQRVAMQGDRIGNRFETFADVWQIVTLASLFAVAAWLRADGVSASRFIAFLAGYAIFQASFVSFCEALLKLMEAQPLAERAKALLSAPTEGAVGQADPGQLTGMIEVSGASFGYSGDGPPLLSQLSFKLHPGEHIAIVGGSGSGKSTVLRLLLGFETPRTGAIFYDGQDLAQLDPTRVRQQIGVVLQSSRLFAGSILENIRGANDLTLEQCLRAAELAGLSRDLELMAMGVHTPITEGAGTLSGGQRQRVLIARAIAGEPRILFFDEATSALDNVTQAIVARTINGMNAARVTIAHRLSTVRNADRICVLSGGRFVETGSFDELIARNGAFAELARRQLLGD